MSAMCGCANGSCGVAIDSVSSAKCVGISAVFFAASSTSAMYSVAGSAASKSPDVLSSECGVGIRNPFSSSDWAGCCDGSNSSSELCSNSSVLCGVAEVDAFCPPAN